MDKLINNRLEITHFSKYIIECIYKKLDILDIVRFSFTNKYFYNIYNQFINNQFINNQLNYLVTFRHDEKLNGKEYDEYFKKYDLNITYKADFPSLDYYNVIEKTIDGLKFIEGSKFKNYIKKINFNYADSPINLELISFPNLVELKLRACKIDNTILYSNLFLPNLKIVDLNNCFIGQFDLINYCDQLESIKLYRCRINNREQFFNNIYKKNNLKYLELKYLELKYLELKYLFENNSICIRKSVVWINNLNEMEKLPNLETLIMDNIIITQYYDHLTNQLNNPLNHPIKEKLKYYQIDNYMID